MSKHVSKAQSERSRKDLATKTKQRGGAVARRLTGEMGTQAAFISVAFAGAAYLKSPQGQVKAKQIVSSIKKQANSQKIRNAQSFVQNLLK